MTSPTVVFSLDERGVARVALNRAQVGNAYNGEMIAALFAAMDELCRRPQLRLLLLTGAGEHFQAGADLEWLRGVSRDRHEENVRVSRATAQVVDRLDRLPVPTLALVQGGCFGGGTGLAAACDVVIAADNAVFSIAEVRWGLTPAILIPQLSDAVSIRQLRRYALTGERFSAAQAQRIGLVHQVVPLEELAGAGEAIMARLLANAPVAMAETKRLVLEHGRRGSLGAHALIESHARSRQSAEAREGLDAFGERRAPIFRR